MTPILSLVFSILLLVSGIMLIVKGFNQSTGWGLINLLVPFGIFFFMAKFWDDAKGPAKIIYNSFHWVPRMCIYAGRKFARHRGWL